MRKKLLFFVLLTCLHGFAFSTGIKNKPKRAVAIVADSEVMKNNFSALKKYAQSMQADGIHAILIEDVWQIPDSIRNSLYKLYKNNNLEGAVFVGDIPVPMIRNAQHLTTAFKMDQNRDWTQSSIPSDRFYDDFDLEFTFVKQDSANSSYFYYNLSNSGAQSVHSNIYSARIKPPHIEGRSKKEMLDYYFDKLVKEKKNSKMITSLTYFAGHGYHSDCMVARIDERMTLTNQFSNLANGKGAITYTDFTYDNSIKDRLLAELNREGVDLAILHHHGSDDTQYLNGTPFTNTPDKWIEMSKKFFRSKIRRAKDTTETKQYYIDTYKVPADWVENAFNPKYVEADSLADLALDLYISDVRGKSTKPAFIMLDACYNGSFHLDDYIAGHYLFNPGNTVVVKANSVNTLQDVWTNQLIGLLDLGVSVGNWAKEQFTLESHLIGDPTYHYQSSRTDLLNLNEEISHHRGDSKLWKKYLKDTNIELQALSMKILFENQLLSLEELYSIQSTHQSPNVRLMAYNLINLRYNHMQESSIKLGLYDSYELIRRFAGADALKNQNPGLVEDLVAITLSPNISKRVEFQVGRAVGYLPEKLVMAAAENYLKGKTGKWYEDKNIQVDRWKSNFQRTQKDFEQLFDEKVSAKSKRLTFQTLRNSNHATYLDLLFKFMKESNDNELKLVLAEAFGWYTTSWKRDEVLSFCKEWAALESNQEVKAELLRTVARLSKS